MNIAAAPSTAAAIRANVCESNLISASSDTLHCRSQNQAGRGQFGGASGGGGGGGGGVVSHDVSDTVWLHVEGGQLVPAFQTDSP